MSVKSKYGTRTRIRGIISHEVEGAALRTAHPIQTTCIYTRIQWSPRLVGGDGSRTKHSVMHSVDHERGIGGRWRWGDGRWPRRRGFRASRARRARPRLRGLRWPRRAWAGRCWLSRSQWERLCACVRQPVPYQQSRRAASGRREFRRRERGPVLVYERAEGAVEQCAHVVVAGVSGAPPSTAFGKRALPSRTRRRVSARSIWGVSRPAGRAARCCSRIVTS